MPALATACPVCFGAGDDSKAIGSAFNIAITLLLGVTASLIATGITWFHRMELRRREFDARTIAQADAA